MIKELATFLGDKTKAKIETGTNDIIVKSDEPAVTRLFLRVLLRKFLHRKDLAEYFRVTGGKENTLVVKERKITVEEE